MTKRLNLFTLVTLCTTSLAHAQSWRGDVWITARDTDQRLAKAKTITPKAVAQPTEFKKFIFIDPNAKFQTVVGIGGALTDAAAETYAKLPPAKQREILEAYYSRTNGIGYTFARTSIHSCDFSSESFTYVNDGDSSLDSFDIAHDKQYRIPFIKAAMAEAEKAGHPLKLFVSPWSPPAWMKTNNSMLKGGSLLPEHAATWANYYVKFIRAYEAAGVPIWGLTVQNEPMAVQTWESCVFTADEERDFVKNHLGPTLKKAGLGDKKLIVWDHNRGLMYHRANTILSDKDAAQYVWGVGFHWYLADRFENVRFVQDRFPNIGLVFTEGCAEHYDGDRIGNWQWGERYGESMIHDFNNGVVAWTDWNVVLDERGGPNHVGNFCYAPIHANTKTGELTFMNSYYYLGHFSKFVQPGARRVIASAMWDELLATAFVNPDGSVVAILMNATEDDHEIGLSMNGHAAELTSPKRSMMTVVMREEQAE